MMRTHLLKLMLLVLGAAGAVMGEPAGQDWPQWRGPARTGFSTDSRWTVDALKQGARIRWKKSVGQGYAQVVVSSACAYTFGNQTGKDVLMCLDAETGEEKWTSIRVCSAGNYPGPRATPLVDGETVYTVSRDGVVRAVSAEGGGETWQVKLIGLSGPQFPKWGVSGSPLLVGERLIINVGGHGVALEKSTGKLLWRSPPGRGGYASPVAGMIAGTEQVVLFGEKAVAGVDPATGEKLWSESWVTRYSVNAADPLFIEEAILVTSGYGRGAALLSVRGPATETVWKARVPDSHFSTPVLVAAHLYGVTGLAGGAQLCCVDAATGETRWTHKLGGGALIASGDTLIVLDERGTLRLVAADSAGYRERASTSLPADGSKWWTAPSLAQGLLYCRSAKGTVDCVDLRK